MDELYSYESPSMVSHSPMINYRKDAKKGIKFSIMVVGELGTGKTTFINSLLGRKILNHQFENGTTAATTETISFTSAQSVALPNTSILTRNQFNPATAHEEPGIAITETKIDIVDEANKLQLTVIDTPGFGDNLNNEICFVEIENYLKQQFDLVLAEETRIRRNPRFVDTRVHVMLYFISATGHGLKELDISCMKRLAKYVNIIPVISKADSFTEAELARFKRHVRADLDKYNVPVFRFDNYLNEYDPDEDYELIQECQYLAGIQPFAVIGSDHQYEVTDLAGRTKVVRARQYLWGMVDINDAAYSDFAAVKAAVLGSHLQDLKDLTHDFLYETYRTERLTKVTGRHGGGDDNAMVGSAVPSLSNLAQLASASANPISDDTVTADSRAPQSMLLDDTVEEMPSPQLKDTASVASSGSTVSGDKSPRDNTAFKRMSIGPQRSQLRQISETVPYVIRHERILERQHKLEQMEMASAQELASRAAMLEKRAAELKAREKALRQAGAGLKKDETLTDLHSIVDN